MFIRFRKAQNVLEYILVLTAIVAAIAYAAIKFVKPAVQESTKHVADQMEIGVKKISF